MTPGQAEALAQPPIRSLRAYDPGHDLGALRRRFGPLLAELGANESPFGAAPQALEAARQALEMAHRYPDPMGQQLRQALAGAHGVDPSGIVLGNGSHELLMMAGQLFAGPGLGVALPNHGFAVHLLSALAAGAAPQWASALPPDHPMPLGHDLEALATAVTPQTRLLFVANPNNPTGTWFARDELEKLLCGLPDHVVVVVDEAYQEYVTDPEAGSAVALLPKHPRLVVTRTFSKAHGLAGLRVGYALMDPQLAGLFERLRESFNVNGPALAAATAALAAGAHLQSVRDRNAGARAALAAGLAQRGLRCLPSQTNFVLAHFGERCASLEPALVERGVVVRPMLPYGLGDWLRISAGSEDEHQRLFRALDEVLA